MSLDPQLGPTDKNYGRTRLGPTLKLRFVSTALQNLQLALCEMHGQWPGTEPQQGMGAEVGRSKNILEAGSPHTLYDLLVFLALFGSRRLSEIGRGGLSAGKGWSRARREEDRRGTSVWAGVHGVGPGPGSRVALPGCSSGAGLSQKTPVGGDR